jgi:hypothetical protein
MKKSDLKQLIKPLVKECIHEVLIEEGLLSSVVAEVAKGMQGNLVVESNTKQEDRLFIKQEDHLFKEGLRIKHKTSETNAKLEEHRKKMMDSVGRDAYNGVNLFENVDPMQHGSPAAGTTDLGNPSDSGVDITSLMGGASKVWQAIK